MAGVKYGYALDEQGRVVSIKQAYLEREAGHSYYCIGCGAGMRTRLGVVRDWHFAHRAEEEHCNSETYLHKLVKRLIREKFEKDEPFEVGYYRDVICSDKESCPFSKADECLVNKLETFDLKEFYDTCEEERSVGGFVADLLLTNFSKPDRAPVLIEIQVSHKSTQQKCDSGLRIIEIRVKSEDDITALLSAPIVENPNAQFGRVKDIETIGFAKFHNFKKKSSTSEPLAARSIPRFYLFKSGKAFVTNMDEIKSCRDVWTKDNEKAIFEASIDSFYLGDPSPYEFGYVAAKDHGIPVKTCQLCKYHRNGYARPMGLSPIFCCLYKKYGTPEEPEQHFAKDCPYYYEDKKYLNQIRNLMPPIAIPGTKSW